jgi:hypothetical protein
VPLRAAWPCLDLELWRGGRAEVSLLIQSAFFWHACVRGSSTLWSCDRVPRRTLHRMPGPLAKTPLAGAFVCLHVGVVRVLIFEDSPSFGGLAPRLAAKLRPPKVPFVLGSASNRVPAAMAWAGRC